MDGRVVATGREVDRDCDVRMEFRGVKNNKMTSFARTRDHHEKQNKPTAETIVTVSFMCRI